MFFGFIIIFPESFFSLDKFRMIDKWIDTNDNSDDNDDTEPDNDQKKDENHKLFFGCFKYDPAIIGPRIKRPLTPFLNNKQIQKC